MARFTAIALPALILFTSAPAGAAGVSPEAAISKYCEPLIAGATANRIADIARRDGLRPEVVAGQPVMRLGELLVRLSDRPRVCFVQAPLAMSLQQGFALVDAWASRNPGAIRSTVTRGPDGALVRGWSAPARKVGIIATQQRASSGQKVMAFILMPHSPPRAAR